jgi:hypothetical protein
MNRSREPVSPTSFASRTPRLTLGISASSKNTVLIFLCFQGWVACKDEDAGHRRAMMINRVRYLLFRICFFYFLDFLDFLDFLHFFIFFIFFFFFFFFFSLSLSISLSLSLSRPALDSLQSRKERGQNQTWLQPPFLSQSLERSCVLYQSWFF